MPCSCSFDGSVAEAAVVELGECCDTLSRRGGDGDSRAGRADDCRLPVRRAPARAARRRAARRVLPLVRPQGQLRLPVSRRRVRARRRLHSARRPRRRVHVHARSRLRRRVPVDSARARARRRARRVAHAVARGRAAAAGRARRRRRADAGCGRGAHRRGRGRARADLRRALRRARVGREAGAVHRARARSPARDRGGAVARRSRARADRSSRCRRGRGLERLSFPAALHRRRRRNAASVPAARAAAPRRPAACGRRAVDHRRGLRRRLRRSVEFRPDVPARSGRLAAPLPARGAAAMIAALRARKEWQFFTVLPKADAALAALWWAVLVVRGVLPAVFAIAMGALVGAVQRGDALAVPLAIVGAAFVLLQILAPIHQAISSNFGDRTAAWIYDRLTDACVRPPGMGHIEDATLMSDLTVAREFDLGMTGPPLSISMDFIATGLVDMLGGVACALLLFGYAWWAPILLGGGWLATHWLLRESAVWPDRNTDAVSAAQRLEPAMAAGGALPPGSRAASGMPSQSIRFRNVTFAYPGGAPVLEHLDLTIPNGTSLAIVGQNGAGKTTLAKLICRLYDPAGGAIEIDGVDLRDLDIDAWRVRHADRICVLEHGRVVELGTHGELMAKGGRYKTMFDLQAQRFTSGEPDEEGATYDVLA